MQKGLVRRMMGMIGCAGFNPADATLPRPFKQKKAPGKVG